MELMKRDEAAKGRRVVFVGGPASGLGELGSALIGKEGTIVYGISEDIFCYPDDQTDDMVWVAFDADRLPRRQVSLSFLEQVY
jgi:hypothetical protein